MGTLSEWLKWGVSSLDKHRVNFGEALDNTHGDHCIIGRHRTGKLGVNSFEFSDRVTKRGGVFIRMVDRQTQLLPSQQFPQFVQVLLSRVVWYSVPPQTIQLT
ncbi:MAG TPA: hypothetical protein VHE60_09170 [Pyrinomonadaceae bacterium]|nr:hypothetical protein [Pyrinomonadaceae bacterium]